MKPVVVAGVGPAGLSAAIHLRRSGVPVEVFERRDDVGVRLIGEYQILESYSRKEDARRACGSSNGKRAEMISESFSIRGRSLPGGG